MNCLNALFQRLIITCGARVTQLEADRLEENREQREDFQRMLRQEVERQARDKKLDIHLPPDR